MPPVPSPAGAAQSPSNNVPKSAAKAAEAEREALASGKLRVRRVERDDAGKPLLPINAKGAQVQQLGRIVHDRPGFHNQKVSAAQLARGAAKRRCRSTFGRSAFGRRASCRRLWTRIASAS